ncbi:hypothetical protein HYDPIDRAFT_165996 [Hydnomerulius pinastri MD-312]|nr:hypothetical protein HYDPIDRAFT_165996 [Hydnomerulius pinastri MD-312]
MSTKRCEAVLQAPQTAALSPKDVVNVWETIPDAKYTHAELEDLGFLRALYGYKQASLREWDVLLSDKGLTETEIRDAFSQESHMCDEMGSLDPRRLIKRNNILLKHHQEVQSHSIIPLLCRQTEALKFACDWNAFGEQVGGKKWKKSFFEAAFKETDKAVDPTDKEGYAKAFKAYRSHMDKIITARNRLMALYNTVSDLGKCATGF